MWNTFEASKLQLLEECDSLIFPEDPALQRMVSSIMEKGKAISFSSAKAQAIAWLLENAPLHIGAEDIFVHRIGHGQLMKSFTYQAIQSTKDHFGTFGGPDWEGICAFRANMDFAHIAPDWPYLLRSGIPGVIADLEEGLEKHSLDPGKCAYYRERLLVYRAIQTCFLRFSEKAAALQTEKGRFIAENLHQLAHGAPATLAQAMQLILLFYVIQTELDAVTVRSLGGLDRMLHPLFQKDLSAGRYTKEQLAEITKFFLWDIRCMEVVANLPFYICGTDENGKDATNSFTTFLLNVYRDMDIYDPKLHVLYHEAMDKQVLHLILEMIREGKSSFVFINTALASRALEQIGIAPDDAKKVIVYGCYETAAEGTEIPCTCGGMINLVKSVELVLSGNKQFPNFEEFYREVLATLENYTAACMDAITSYEHRYADICPSLIMSPTYRNSRETGTDLYSGGAKYNNTSIVGAGLATLVDSLIVVKKLVFEEKRMALDEFRSVLRSDWAQDPNLRLLVKKKYPKFGNNHCEADTLAADLYDRFTRLINGRKNGRGGVFRCGMFSVDWRFWMGEKTDATPDGRFRGAPLSKNLAASIGQDKNGVTAYLNSLLKMDGAQCPDGYVADVVLHSSAVKGEDGLRAFEGLLVTFMKKGGFSVHFNILSPETLINAQKEPEKYQNLQIRLCGWNVRFVDLDKAQQDEFIKQSLNVM